MKYDTTTKAIIKFKKNMNSIPKKIKKKRTIITTHSFGNYFVVICTFYM